MCEEDLSMDEYASTLDADKMCVASGDVDCQSLHTEFDNYKRSVNKRGQPLLLIAYDKVKSSLPDITLIERPTPGNQPLLAE
jgi:hypothetical protein